jgi:hypothetical protein
MTRIAALACAGRQRWLELTYSAGRITQGGANFIMWIEPFEAVKMYARFCKARYGTGASPKVRKSVATRASRASGYASSPAESRRPRRQLPCPAILEATAPVSPGRSRTDTISPARRSGRLSGQMYDKR